MAKFIDRDKELATLEREYARNGASLVILYGRRRVGKTTLISEFIKDKPALSVFEIRGLCLWRNISLPDGIIYK